MSELRGWTGESGWLVRQMGQRCGRGEAVRQLGQLVRPGWDRLGHDDVVAPLLLPRPPVGEGEEPPALPPAVHVPPLHPLPARQHRRPPALPPEQMPPPE